MDPADNPLGIPAALLAACPSLGGRDGIRPLRLGHLPMLARLAPHVLDPEVPLDEVAWADAILATDGRHLPAHPSQGLRGDSAAAALAAIQNAHADAFSAAIPYTFDGAERSGPGNGLGWWLQLYHFALAALHLSRSDAFAMPLGELFALSSANAAALGATFKAPTYAERDLLEALQNDGDP